MKYHGSRTLFLGHWLFAEHVVLFMHDPSFSVGKARRKQQDPAPIEQPKMGVNLPPMVSTREGKLLSVEVHAR